MARGQIRDPDAQQTGKRVNNNVDWLVERLVKLRIQQIPPCRIQVGTQSLGTKSI